MVSPGWQHRSKEQDRSSWVASVRRTHQVISFIRYLMTRTRMFVLNRQTDAIRKWPITKWALEGLAGDMADVRQGSSIIPKGASSNRKTNMVFFGSSCALQMRGGKKKYFFKQHNITFLNVHKNPLHLKLKMFQQHMGIFEKAVDQVYFLFAIPISKNFRTIEMHLLIVCRFLSYFFFQEIQMISGHQN